MTDKLKIIFAGTPEIASLVLANILQHGFEVALVLTQPDRPAGRGMKLSASPVKMLAESHQIEVFQPLSLRNNPEAWQKIAAVAADIMVVVAYGLILPAEVLSLPRLGCVNIHVSLLPRWRGAAPIQRAVLAGDLQSGVTIMQMDPGLDSGDILLVEKVNLDRLESSASLHAKLATLGAKLIVEFLVQPSRFKALKQPDEGISYAAKIEKAEALIDWQQPALLIERKIRGFNPFPGAFSFLDGHLHKIWQARLLSSTRSSKPAGTVVLAEKDHLWVACGDGEVLAVEEIQVAGGKRQSALQFLQAKSKLADKQFNSQ